MSYISLYWVDTAAGLAFLKLPFLIYCLVEALIFQIKLDAWSVPERKNACQVLQPDLQMALPIIAKKTSIAFSVNTNDYLLELISYYHCSDTVN